LPSIVAARTASAASGQWHDVRINDDRSYVDRRHPRPAPQAPEHRVKVADPPAQAAMLALAPERTAATAAPPAAAAAAAALAGAAVTVAPAIARS
jgi:hypothetical protein